MLFGQVVMGPAGCGKSTYCYSLQQRALDSARNVLVINLDPVSVQVFWENTSIYFSFFIGSGKLQLLCVC